MPDNDVLFRRIAKKYRYKQNYHSYQLLTRTPAFEYPSLSRSTGFVAVR